MANAYDYSGPQAGMSFDSLPGQFTAFRAAFDEELGAALSFDFNPFVLPQNLNGGLTLDLETIRGIAIMKRWAGAKVVEDALTGYANVIKTIPWEATESIMRREYNANPNGLGLVTNKIAGLADEASQHALRMFAAALEANGRTVAVLTALGIESDLVAYLALRLGLDGVALFATNHPMANGSTYSNISTGAGHNTTSFLNAQIAMKKIPETLHGRRLDNRPTHVMVPIGLGPVYKQMVESPLVPENANHGVNPNLNAVTVVENPFLLDDTRAYLINARRSQMKPIVYAYTNPAHLVQQTNPESEPVFSRGAYLFGAESDGYIMVPGHAFTAYCIGT